MGEVSSGITRQPVSHVEWVDRAALRANSYNPNRVFPPELQLLKISLLADGWTQPIVIRADGEIVDGYHRYLIAADAEVAALTAGKVPVVRLPATLTYDHQICSTIRHNRARGSHAVLSMAEIVRQLIDSYGMDWEKVQHVLQMEWEEVDRLYDRGGMTQRGSKDTFNAGWVPQEK